MNTNKLIPLGLLSAAALVAPSVACAAQEAVARDVIGKVHYHEGNGDGARVELKPGTFLRSGSVIETESDSGAEIRLPDASRLEITANSLIILVLEKRPAHAYEIVLLRGGVHGDARARGELGAPFLVRTAVGKANIAGASYVVSYTPKSPMKGVMSIATKEGVASVSAPTLLAPVSVRGGEWIRIPESSKATRAPHDVFTPAPLRPPAPPPAATASTPASSGPHKLPDTGVFLVSPNGEGQVN